MRTAKVIFILVTLALILGIGTALFSQEPPQPPPSKPTTMTPVTPGESNPQLQPIKPVSKPAPPPPAPVDPEKAPKCVVAKTEFDGGAVTKGDVIKHAFEVENQGKGPLEITRVQPACGCTLSEYDKVIEVGKKGKITLSVTTANFKGPISKSTSVATNDPNMASFQLIIKGDVKEIISVQPSENMQLGLIYKGQKVEKEFTLKAMDDKPFQITQVDPTDPSVKYDLKMAEDKKSATIKVMVPEDHAVGAINARFTLTTNHPKVPTISLNCFGTIREPLTVYPPTLTYAGLSKEFVEKNPTDASLTKPITLAFVTARDFEVKSVKCDLPCLKVTQETLEQGKRYTVKVLLQNEGLQVGDFSGTVTIETNKKTITIPVKGKIF
jgi:hypothetical protein